MAGVAPKMSSGLIDNCIAMASDMLKLPTQHIWLDYDKEADVLYMSFRKSQRATQTIEMDKDILVRKDRNNIVGMTILNASMR